MAVLARPSLRPAPSPGEVGSIFERVLEDLAAVGGDADAGTQARALGAATEDLSALDVSLRGVPGLAYLLGDPAAIEAVEDATARVDGILAGFEAALEAGGVAAETAQLEELNAALVRARDVLWALRRDRLEAARSVAELVSSLGLSRPGVSGKGPNENGPDTKGRSGTGQAPGAAALGVLWAVHVAFRSLDRLEVRGRDSAGVHLMLEGHGLDLLSEDVKSLIETRSSDALFTSLGARSDEGCLSLVYKAAAEIGELGDNVAALRKALGTDPLLARALASPDVRATVVGHTRWASVGLISEPNAHPLNSDEAKWDGAKSGAAKSGAATTGPQNPYVIGVLNGDIDNYSELVVREDVAVPSEITTDAKLVPTLIARYLSAGESVAQAFRKAVERFDGSVGIAANAAYSPDDLYLALRGSGQSLNIGLAEDAFVVASEPYGLVEETRRYIRMDGEKGGQVVRCSVDGAGTLAGITRWRYDGTELPVSESEVMAAEITTRDVDRQGFKHFLLKEITESPLSVRKTLRGKMVTGENGRLVARLGDDVIPPALRRALSSGQVRSIMVIGQGTAAVAGQAVAAAIARALPVVPVTALPASELSGWGPNGIGLPDDMSGTLVVAISQSGTTTDTNRTVDLLRARGARVIAIVNRRNSDLVQKAHGVLYTSDGRDVEMSVASTKAFYSQVAAGHLLALGLASAAGVDGSARQHEILDALRKLPSLMEKVLANRPEIGRVAWAVAPPRRSWAVVGSGPDRVAAAEVRIKLSELCYKAIALDAIEDKKHIDLSAEPLVIVCAASVGGPNAHDIAKEIDIFRAHKAAPVVIVTESERDVFNPNVEILSVPECHPELAFVLAAMAGHLFGYEAALAIDALARPLREARTLLEGATRSEDEGSPLNELVPDLDALAGPLLVGLRSGACDGHLNASTAARLTSLLGYATGALPVEGYESEMGKVGAPSAIAIDLVMALGVAIDELTRPVDAIKHQAKTVTVGISRSEDSLLRERLVEATLAAGASVEALGYRALRALAALGPAVEEVLGYTRYRIDASPNLEGATISVMAQGGTAKGIPSRTATDNKLKGTKHRVADKREVTVFKGLHDARTGVMVPEVKDGQVTGITLLHASFVPLLGGEEAKAVLQAYQGRYTALVDAVTEDQPYFDDDVLGQVPPIELLTEPVAVLADYWLTSSRAPEPVHGAGNR
ncbi:MAG TPA: SIS domain-containing protein [Acidimicrobiales bacterium]|nr:SIS domain-containing protein [Acidimicrobiales bacterium]